MTDPTDPAAELTIRPARTHDPAEVDRLYEICLRTGDHGGDASALTAEPRLVGDVYLGAYLRLAPELAFVLVDPAVPGPEGVLGYVVGVADTAAFQERLEREWWPELRERHPLGAHVSAFDADLVRAIHHPEIVEPAIVARYPAHLHVDLLPDAQGGGHGRRLLATLFDALRASGVPGVHLGVSLRNTAAIGFYEHLGFRQLTADGGLLGLDLSTP
jgi:ribosomal protein S18 acetylase RimI-like enzyme